MRTLVNVEIQHIEYIHEQGSYIQIREQSISQGYQNAKRETAKGVCT